MRKTLFTEAKGPLPLRALGSSPLIRKVCCTNEVYTHANIRKNYCQIRDYMLNFVSLTLPTICNQGTISLSLC